ncbi:MFS transporter [Phosphitispora sp. TUW77]|uniref:MFS transporter n=1 Tax=Phosphitispora sp. TUW77 TaxID=3152361 RepID=UPI003AB2640E
MNSDKSAVQPDIWTRPFMLIVLVNFLMFTSMYVLLPTLPVYAKSIGGSETVAGLIVGLFTFAAVLVRPFSGSLLDSKGRKAVMIAGIAIFIVSAVSFTWAYLVWMLLALRIVHGLGWGVTTTASGTVASDIIPAARRGEGMGYYGMSSTIAMSIGPALGLAIINNYSFKLLFLVSALFAVAGLLIGLFINYDGISGKMGEGSTEVAGGTKTKGVLFEKSSVPPSLVMFFASLSYGGIVTFMKPYADFRGIENIGPFFTVYALVLLFSRPVMGRMADKYGAGRLLVPGILFIATALLILMNASSMTGFLLAAILYSIGFGAVHPILSALVISFVVPERRGAANATFASAMDMGIGLGAVILGAISERAGYSLMYGSSTVFALLALVVYFAILRPRLAEQKLKGENR